MGTNFAVAMPQRAVLPFLPVRYPLLLAQLPAPRLALSRWRQGEGETRLDPCLLRGGFQHGV